MKLANLVIAVITLSLLTGCGESAANYNNQGNQQYEKEKYAEALDNYRLSHQLNPDLPQPYYNAGNAYFRQGNLKAAQAQTEQSIKTAKRVATTDLAQQSYYNLGNNFFQTQDYAAAVDAYKDALRLKPDDVDAKHNLELALKMQQQQQQQQGSGQQQDQQGGQQQQQPPQQGQQGKQPPQDQQGGGGQQQQDQSSSGSKPQEQKPQPSQNGEQLSPQEAKQILDALGQKSQTLQERLNQTDGGGSSDGFGGAPKSPPTQDW